MSTTDRISTILSTKPHLLKAELCRRSFFHFVQEFWSAIITEEPVYNWHIPYLCAELEKVLWNLIGRNTKAYDLIINIPPGTTKTTVASIMFPAWAWVARLPEGLPSRIPLDPNKPDPRPSGVDLRFIAGSFSKDISIDNSSKSRDIIMCDKYMKYFPEVRIRADKNAKSHFVNTEHGSRFTTSVGTSPMGQHAHCIIIDDPVNPQEAMSDIERYAANEWIGNITTRTVRKDMTPLVLIMQRLHEDDPTATVLRRHKDVRHIRLPATDEWEISPPELREKYVDGFLDPIRVPESVLREQLSILGPYGFAGQFGQDPRPREGGLFQKEWFEIVDRAPEGGVIVRGWDLAASKKKQGAAGAIQAATSGVKLKLVGAKLVDGKMIGGTIYIMDDLNFFGTSDEVRRTLRSATISDGIDCVQDIPQDPGQAGKSQVKDLVALLQGYRVRYSVESGDKVVRADPFSAQCEAGNVKLVKGAWNEAWLDEMTIFPNGRKDRCDATVRAYNRALKEYQMHGNFDLASPIGVSGLYSDPTGGPQ